MLARLFIRGYEDTTNPRVRNAYGVLVSIVGAILNVILSVSKIVVGAMFGAVAVLADGLNNLSDAGSSVITMFGFRIANRPADKNHPFGHARVEYVISLIISFIVLFLGLELVISSVEKLIVKGTTEVTIVLMVVLAVSIIVKLFMALYYRAMGKKIDSSALHAMSVDSVSDILSTTAVLVSMIITYFAHVELDGYVGIIVAVIILVGGAKLFKETLSPLLGEAPSKEFVENICSKVRSYDGVLGIHDLMAHNYGTGKYYVSLHVEVDANRDILEGHDLIDKIERDFKDDGIDMVIHLDPVVTDNEQVNMLRKMVKEAIMEIDPSITFHDFRAVIIGERQKIIFDIVLPQGYNKSDDEVMAELTKKIVGDQKNRSIIVDIDRNYIDA